MACCSSCISGFAAFVALLAFTFDIGIFFAAKARINKIGSAQIGNATWLTLAAWVLLFFSSTFFSLGRCCISKRPKKQWGDDSRNPDGTEQLRLDAVKAEADRKARQNRIEGGLPAFPEYQPLTGYVDGDKVHSEHPYGDANSTYGGQPTPNGYSGGGYVRAPDGSRAVDDYYSPSRNVAPSSPTIHHVQATSAYSDTDSNYTQNIANNRQPASRQASNYVPSQYSASVYTQSTSPPPINSYLPPTAPQLYGHGAGGTSCNFFLPVLIFIDLDRLPQITMPPHRMHNNQPVTPTTTLMITNSVLTTPLQLRIPPMTSQPITIPRRHYNLSLSVATRLVVEATMKGHIVSVPPCPYPARPRTTRHRHLSRPLSTRI